MWLDPVNGELKLRYFNQWIIISTGITVPYITATYNVANATLTVNFYNSNDTRNSVRIHNSADTPTNDNVVTWRFLDGTTVEPNSILPNGALTIDLKPFDRGNYKAVFKHSSVTDTIGNSVEFNHSSLG